MLRTKNLIPVFLYIMTGFLPSCDKKDVAEVQTNYGQPQTLGGGEMKSFSRVDENEKLVALGVAISESAIASLPHMMAEYVLEIPGQTPASPFRFLYINYMHEGHGPAGVYTVPHFDCHFYTVPNADRLTMLAENMDLIKKAPSDMAVLPDGFIPTTAVPLMGQHWQDAKSPEFSGQPFTQTFIYGTYNGSVVFQEPMIAVSYLLQKKNEVFKIRQPQKFQAKGLIPADYAVRYNSREKQYEVTVESFEEK